jgi:hypothetical protein
MKLQLCSSLPTLVTLFALGSALPLSGGCSSFDGEPLTSDDMLDDEPQARPAAGPPVERVGQVELAFEPETVPATTSLAGVNARAPVDARTETTSDVLSTDQASLAGDRMTFQSQLLERLNKVDLRLAAARRELAKSGDLQTSANASALLTTFNDARNACSSEQDALVITPNDAWPTARERLLARVESLEGYVGKIESLLGMAVDGPNEL